MHRFLVLTMGFLFAGALARADVSLPSKTLLPGGVADPVANVGYVQHTDGNIVALDLQSGKTVWSVPAFGRPVALNGDKLLVLGWGKVANRVEVLFIDQETRTRKEI